MQYDRKISAAMREHKRMSVPLAVKSIDGEGRFAGYASVFDVVDSHRDVIERGAFADTIHNRAHEVKLLWQHQQDAPIGVCTRLFEDTRGLYMEGELLMGVRQAREAATLMKAGAVSGLSIGYSPTRYTIDAESGVRRLKAVELWEISLVTFPANEAAKVTVVKAVSHVRPRPQGNEKVHPALLVPLAEALTRAAEAFL